MTGDFIKFLEMLSFNDLLDEINITTTDYFVDPGDYVILETTTDKRKRQKELRLIWLADNELSKKNFVFNSKLETIKAFQVTPQGGFIIVGLEQEKPGDWSFIHTDKDGINPHKKSILKYKGEKASALTHFFDEGFIVGGYGYRYNTTKHIIPTQFYYICHC